MEFKTWIEVSFERMETLKALELPDVFTTDVGAGRIRVVEQSRICSAALYQWNKEQPTLAILPTSKPLVSFHPNVYVVPYSDHSSYQELEDFVSALRPTSIVPIVGNNLPGSLSALLPSKKRHEFLVPESVQHYMFRQPESQVSSSAYTSLCRRHFRPVVPKGVVFESPARGSRNSCEEAWAAECLEQDASDEELDTDSSEKDSDCIPIDLSKDTTPNKNGGGAGHMWNLNLVPTLSEDTAVSVPLSQFTQSNFAPMEILTSTRTCLKSARTVRGFFGRHAKIYKRASNQNYSCPHSKHGHVQNNYAASDGDRTSLHSVHGFDQDDDVMSNCNNTSQHSGHRTDPNDSVTTLQRSLNKNSCSSTSPITEYIQQLENSILKDLPFTKEDIRASGLLSQSFVQQFPLCPLYDA